MDVVELLAKEGGILVVDDDGANLSLLESFLTRWGYPKVRTATDGRAALEQFDEELPALVLLDLHMAGMDGFELLAALAARRLDGFVPVIALTADATARTKRRALELGASDVLTKPFDPVELELRTANMLKVHAWRLLVSTELFGRLAYIAEYREDETKQHTARVGRNAGHVARTLGLTSGEIDCITLAAPLHDIGKVAIPDRILLKAGPLDEAERELMMSHCAVGAQILGGSGEKGLELASEIALAHHEHVDGSGYPSGRAGEAIPLAARITAVIDVYDALVHDRVYRPAWPVGAALEELRRGCGRAFDADVVGAVLSLAEDGRLE